MVRNGYMSVCGRVVTFDTVARKVKEGEEGKTERLALGQPQDWSGSQHRKTIERWISLLGTD